MQLANEQPRTRTTAVIPDVKVLPSQNSAAQLPVNEAVLFHSTFSTRKIVLDPDLNSLDVLRIVRLFRTTFSTTRKQPTRVLLLIRHPCDESNPLTTDPYKIDSHPIHEQSQNIEVTFELKEVL